MGCIFKSVEHLLVYMSKSSRRDFLRQAGLVGVGGMATVGLAGCSERNSMGYGDTVADYTVTDVRDEDTVFSDVSGEIELQHYSMEIGSYSGKAFLSLDVDTPFEVNHNFWVYYANELLYSGVFEAGKENYNIGFLIKTVREGGYRLKIAPPNEEAVSAVFFSFSEIKS